MKYRPEIDGLRCLAVIPVILFHGGFKLFSGGFVGVDIFFVISGYLITSIILDDLSKDKFSILDFYERRARRILPCLFIVMLVSSFLGYKYMLPAVYKSFGQSLVATVLFSNNILLSKTSGYWELAAEYKPLLHTWSLGVEEQFYILFPLFLIFGWKFYRKNLTKYLFILCLVSLLLAIIGCFYRPDSNFYFFPSRSWEILSGSLLAFSMYGADPSGYFKKRANLLSFTGFILVLISIVLFNKGLPQPSLYTIIPVAGTLLIIRFAIKETFVNKLLSNRLMVGIGLISYSLYLWHQPIFSFSRILSLNGMSNQIEIVFLFLFNFLLSYFSWKYIENFFRNKELVSRKVLSFFCVSFSLLFIFFGIYVHKTYGLSDRFFSSTTKIEDVDESIYNEKIRVYAKKSKFNFPERIKILVFGNSYARDFINSTIETFDSSAFEIVYRSQFNRCILPYDSSLFENLVNSSDVIVFYLGDGFRCVEKNIEFAKAKNKKIFYLGTKAFGYNLNWLMRIGVNQRANQYNDVPPSVLLNELEMSSSIPKENYISLMSPILKNGKIPITDNSGNLLSSDGLHLTKAGAVFFGKIIKESMFGDILLRGKAKF